MKTIKTNLLLILSFIAILVGCSNDDTVKIDSSPEFQSIVDEISSLPGQTFVFEGVISDPAGIKSINIKYEPWFLDKTIVKSDSIYKTYELAYRFKVPNDAVENSTHTIPITVTNIGGKSTTKNVVVTLDQDIEKPIINISKPINGATVLIGSGNEIELDITVTDAELSEFKIESDVLNEAIPISGTSYTYTKSLDISDEGSYSFTITATDASGNAETKTVYVNVLSELLFDNMYLTDLKTNDALVGDLFGVPFNTEASVVPAEDGYVFTAKYYASSPNAEVRFIPQKESFEPYTFGANPNVPGELVLGTDANVDPIVLPEVGYYEIKMDLRNQSYTVTPYTPSDVPFNQVYIIGTGIYIDSNVSTCTDNTTGGLRCWHFLSGKPFTKDDNNPYLWSIDVTVKEEPNNDGVNGFILNANPNGWSPFWRMNPDDPSETIPNGGSNFVFPDTALDKDYTIIFDTHLNRLSIINR